jgi:hypothetical protein
MNSYVMIVSSRLSGESTSRGVSRADTFHFHEHLVGSREHIYRRRGVTRMRWRCGSLWLHLPWCEGLPLERCVSVLTVCAARSRSRLAVTHRA